jgi:predicted ATP-grasp superfamily ATP-dependent carboligase
MSSYVSIDRTVFHTIDADGTLLGTSFGFRIYDDDVACYDNSVQSLDELKALSQEELIQRANELSEQAADMVEFAVINGLPIIVDGIDVNADSNNDATPIA